MCKPRPPRQAMDAALEISTYHREDPTMIVISIIRGYSRRLTFDEVLFSRSNNAWIVAHIHFQWILFTSAKIFALNVQNSSTFHTATCRGNLCDSYSGRTEGSRHLQSLRRKRKSKENRPALVSKLYNWPVPDMRYRLLSANDRP